METTRLSDLTHWHSIHHVVTQLILLISSFNLENRIYGVEYEAYVCNQNSFYWFYWVKLILSKVYTTTTTYNNNNKTGI